MNNLKQFLTRKSTIVYLILSLILLGIYLPFIVSGGFLQDDWGVINRAGNVVTDSLRWFPLLAYRPLFPFYLGILVNIFGDWAAGYVLVNLGLWLGALFIIGSILRKHFDWTFFVVFMLFGSIPVIATSFIFSPVIQSIASLSVFVWAVSFWLLDKYLVNRKKLYLGTVFFLIVCCMLLYEVILPLLTISVLYPFYIEYKDKRLLNLKHWFMAALKYILPIILILVADYLFQKILLPQVTVSYSRLSGGLFTYILTSGLRTIEFWAFNLLINYPILLFVSFKNGGFVAALPNLILIIIPSIALLILGLKEKFNTEPKQKNLRQLILILIVAFFSSSFLYLLASTIPMISGYINRAGSTTWLLFSIMIALFAYSLKKYAYITVFILFILTTNTYLIQRNNYLESVQIQTRVTADLAQKLTEAGATKGVTVVGNVPAFVTNNLNDEDVFSHAWDFGYAISMNSGGFIKGGNTITKGKSVALVDNVLILDGYWTATINDNLWYYEFDQVKQESFVRNIKTNEELAQLVNDIKTKTYTSEPASTYPQRQIFEFEDNLTNKNFDAAADKFKTLQKSL